MKIRDMDCIVRSKNAGPFRITVDLIFKNKEAFETVKDSGVWTKESIAALYNISVDWIYECLTYEPAYSFKCTFRRAIPSGTFRDTDIYGAQQHTPLYDLIIK
jgi:hypothetical protein